MYFLLHYVLYLLIFAPISHSDLFTNNSYVIDSTNANDNSWTIPTFYWINTDSSTERRKWMTKHLQYLRIPNQRVQAVTPIKLRFMNNSRVNISCLFDSHNALYQNVTTETDASPITLSSFFSLHPLRLSELACTVSHLLAIEKALNDKTGCPYAVIAEDDIQFSFGLDFRHMIRTAPQNFTILQLQVNNIHSISWLWSQWQEKSVLWAHRPRGEAVYSTSFSEVFWSTGLYLVDKRRLRPVISRLLRQIHWRWRDVEAARTRGREEVGERERERRSHQAITLHLVAGVTDPHCMPSYCCSGTRFHPIPPCVLSRFGLLADQFIYALGETYTLTAPVTQAYSGVSQNSTINPKHKNRQGRAYDLSSRFIQDMQLGRADLPPFAAKFRKSLPI
mmetsp:Transcript_28711/g.29040  ORF Transcript_28711/g.29040 Transcript_28711/m.29040 type:complete len:392 (+) Transcript_28711:87-1262(+)